MPDTDAIARGIGRIPSGCAILTARHGGRRTGMLASWVQQVAFEPPMITVSVKRGRPIGELIDASGQFVVNVLGENPAAMFKHFGAGFAPTEDAFAGVEAKDVPGGVEIADQVARLSARVHKKVEAGDHDLYIAEVTEAAAPELLPPYVHIRKNGLSY